MNAKENNGTAVPNEEPATLSGPAPYEEELKDYSKADVGDTEDDTPATHPEPRPVPTIKI
jgi:hypothetical protein